MSPQKPIRLNRNDLNSVEFAIRYINQHYPDRLSPEWIALEVALPMKKLEAGILQMTGITLHHYLMNVRVERAKLLLAGDLLSIKEIAFQVGFKNQSHFSKVFKKITSITPTEYRNNKAN
jgi:two-component system response regulator YesN